MINWGYTILFFVLTIGSVMLSDYKPFKSKTNNYMFTAVVIAVGLLTWFYILPMTRDGFDNPNSRTDQPCPEGSVKHRNGDCRMKGEGEAP